MLSAWADLEQRTQGLLTHEDGGIMDFYGFKLLNL